VAHLFFGNPLVVALVLGDVTERALRQSLIISDGSLTIFFTRPLAAVFMALACLLFVWPFLHHHTARRRHTAEMS
jgi:putative tricarboxylic transport membrane protein